METKNNIAAILKDKTQGTKLYDWLHNIDVELDTISTTDTETVVWCTNETNNNTTCHRGYSEFGTERGYPDGLQILFPSKEMRDWAKFSWKKGDALIMDGCRVVFDKWLDDTYARFNAVHLITSSGGYFDKPWQNRYTPISNFITEYWRKMTDLETKIYMESLERECGGKLNLTTLEIEKQYEFKNGDIAFADYGNRQDVFIVSDRTNLSEGYISFISLDLSSLTLSMGYRTSFFKKDLCKLRLATEAEKQQLFDALEKEGKAWDAEKKQIVDLPKKCEFKPMDWCLMRDIRGEECFAWSLCQFAYQLKRGKYEAVGGMRFDECIPYNEETAHLLGTTDEWKGGE